MTLSNVGNNSSGASGRTARVPIPRLWKLFNIPLLLLLMAAWPHITFANKLETFYAYCFVDAYDFEKAQYFTIITSVFPTTLPDPGPPDPAAHTVKLTELRDRFTEWKDHRYPGIRANGICEAGTQDWAEAQRARYLSKTEKSNAKNANHSSHIVEVDWKP